MSEAPPSAVALGAISAFDKPHLSGLAADRSYSIGTASRGYLVQGRKLPETDWLKPRPTSLRRKATWGTDEMIGALDRAAKSVAERWPGSVLYAGDLSAEGGGDIRGHASHNSGRDVDLCFYYRDPAGRIADEERMWPIRSDGTGAGGERRFDVPRNWALVEALLRDPHVQVQWLFVASHLQDLLLAHAEAIGADEEVVRRAKKVLKQPGDSSRHAEHFHVRFYCALAERVQGCVDYGPVWDWVDTYEKALARRITEVLPFLKVRSAEENRYAITRLVRLRAVAAVPHLEPLMDSPDPSIRALAADAVAFLRGERTPPAWAHLTEEDPGE